MRARGRVRPPAVALLGIVLLAGCAGPRPVADGIEEQGDGLFTLAQRGPSPAAAVERGLNRASQHCADMNRMISVQSTRIERDGYRIAFRCLPVPGGVPPASGPELAAAPSAVVPAFTTPPAATEAPVSFPAAPQAAAPMRPVTPGGTALPLASSPLPPIAGSGATGAAVTPPSGRLAPSSFWQTGR
ncbi:MAG: hypothetical protein N3D18_09675 [Roseococcus sp.]|nr:hypothetical protein [Roseococcus sp.]